MPEEVVMIIKKKIVYQISHNLIDRRGNKACEDKHIMAKEVMILTCAFGVRIPR